MSGIRPLSRELQEKVMFELNEVPNRVRDDLDHIIEWIHQQPHLNARTDDQWLLNFLRPCKFSLQKTKEKLDLHYTMRTISPYYYQDRNPFSREVQTFCKLGVFAVLPKESNPLASTRVIVVAKNGDPDKVPLKLSVKVILMLGDIYLFEDDSCIINGQEIIIDLKDTPYKYRGQCTPSFLKTLAILIQRAYPARVKGIHLINIPPFAYAVIKAFKQFLSKKIRDRVHVYMENDFDSLYKAIPQAVFPEEYGGSAGSLQKLTEKMRHELESHYKWFEEDAQYGTDESKRPGKAITSDAFFNVEGSFRKLEID